MRPPWAAGKRPVRPIPCPATPSLVCCTPSVDPTNPPVRTLRVPVSAGSLDSCGVGCSASGDAGARAPAGPPRGSKLLLAATFAVILLGAGSGCGAQLKSRSDHSASTSAAEHAEEAEQKRAEDSEASKDREVLTALEAKEREEVGRKQRRQEGKGSHQEGQEARRSGRQAGQEEGKGSVRKGQEARSHGQGEGPGRSEEEVRRSRQADGPGQTEEPDQDEDQQRAQGHQESPRLGHHAHRREAARKDERRHEQSAQTP